MPKDMPYALLDSQHPGNTSLESEFTALSHRYNNLYLEFHALSIDYEALEARLLATERQVKLIRSVKNRLYFKVKELSEKLKLSSWHTSDPVERVN